MTPKKNCTFGPVISEDRFFFPHVKKKVWIQTKVQSSRLCISTKSEMLYVYSTFAVNPTDP